MNKAQAISRRCSMEMTVQWGSIGNKVFYRKVDWLLIGGVDSGIRYTYLRGGFDWQGKLCIF